MMKSEDLVAFIPVDGQVAMNKTPPWKMPAATLYKRLLEKTKGRVLRSDIGWPKDTERPSTVTQAEWKQSRANAKVTVADSFIDFLLE